MTGIGLAVLVAAGAVGMYLTSRPLSPASDGAASSHAGEPLSLDSHFLTTALQLAAYAKTPGARRAAEEALSTAGRELDLQYAYALQLAALDHAPATPAIRALRSRIGKIDKAMAAREAQVSRLRATIQQLRGGRRSALETQLDVRQAELGLLQEALAEANDALDRAGGSLQSQLARLKAQHEALSRERDNFKFSPPGGSSTARSLRSRWSRWEASGRVQSRIREARQAVYAGIAGLTKQQSSLTKRISAEEAQGQAWWNGELTPKQIAALPSSLTVLIERLSSDRVALRILDRRIQDMNALGAAYTRWDTVAGEAGRADLHRLIASCLWIAFAMASAFFFNRLIEHLFAGLSLERRQKATLQAVLRITVQLSAVVIILMIVFGQPHNLSTVLGLAGAGLAIALQDFILSFFGWFVLMGRHGVRVGDFVEINQNAFAGVRGEVIEITPFRTVLLETGNWNEPGHLTGRKVAFMNMFAVSGYYFNFSTSGQWLWDELQVAIPRDESPYPLVDRIRAMVASATERQTQEAEHEWQSVSSRYGTRSFSAEPGVNIRSTDSGMIAVIRYITRADERPALRNHLSHELVKLLHSAEHPVDAAEILLAAEAAGFARR